MNTSPFSTRYVTSDRASVRTVGGAGQRATAGRALVLGGGGSAGNAWVIGVVAGLLDAGVDVTQADLVIGTSAGSTAAAQLTSASPTQLFADIVAAPPRRTPSAGPDPRGAASRPAVDHLRRTSDVIAAADGAADMRRRLGASALGLEAPSDGAGQSRWRATVAARLPSRQWPPRAMLVVAVDAETGEPVVFDRHSGVDLADAIAASCSSGPAYVIGEHRYIDGGYRRSSENADLAAGYGRVLVLSPLGGRSRAPLEWGMHLAAQVDELRAGGSDVETVLPDASALEAFGTNLMDPTTRAPAARAGYDQGRARAEQLSDFWWSTAGR